MVVGCKGCGGACKCVRALSLFQVAAFHWSFPNWPVHIITVHCCMGMQPWLK